MARQSLNMLEDTSTDAWLTGTRDSGPLSRPEMMFPCVRTKVFTSSPQNDGPSMKPSAERKDTRRHYKKDTRFLLDLYTLTYDNHETIYSLEEVRRNDREEIRRRLAMGSDADEYYGGERPGRKPSLQARLQSGMNLQICFMNETVSDTESPNSDTETISSPSKSISPLSQSYSASSTKASTPPPQIVTPSLVPPVTRPSPSSLTLPLRREQPLDQPMTEADFFARQARLQAEARLALAQAKEMAHMQMEVERQRQKKSPITEMVRSSLEKQNFHLNQHSQRFTLMFETTLQHLQDPPTKKQYSIQSHYDCNTSNLINQLQCNFCGAEYIELTTGPLRICMNNHCFDTNHKNLDESVPSHANTHNKDFDFCYTTRVLRAFSTATCNNSQLKQWELAHQWVGIPFPDDRRRVSRQILTEMNLAQLQVIVNDLHTQIEVLNENLVKFLMDRDDLHMEQDSMLVDIEDLTRYLCVRDPLWRKEVPLKCEEVLYRTYFVPIVTYEAETWTLKVRETRKVEAMVLKFVRSMLPLGEGTRLGLKFSRKEGAKEQSVKEQQDVHSIGQNNNNHLIASSKPKINRIASLVKK
uniref:Schwannomin interacting protein 1 C-terminal domain-containing protein n=1 Tax=Timema shepardi TaxID=629360 RepID=A0A7R9FVC5_TIMSH|nr:unnamed protein product [Timema shepardi]